MQIDINTIASATESTQDFSHVTGNADQFVPDLTDDEKIDIAAARILERFQPAFEELAK